MKGHAQDLHEEVDGVAGQIAVWPAPATFFDNQPWKVRQLEIACFPFDELQPALLQQRNQRSLERGADLLARPARVRGSGCHYRAYLEGRVLELGLAMGRKELEAKWKQVRRGWYLGEASFK